MKKMTGRMKGYRTTVFFALTLILGVANLYGFADFQLPPELLAWVGPILSIVGLILRAVTSTSIFNGE